MSLSKPVIIGMLATLISIGGAIAFHVDRQNKIAEEALQYQKGLQQGREIRRRIAEESAREDIEKTRSLVNDRYKQLPDGSWEKITPETAKRDLEKFMGKKIK
jgi:hypothetical protein